MDQIHLNVVHRRQNPLDSSQPCTHPISLLMTATDGSLHARGALLQVARSRVLLPMRLLQFSVAIVISAALWSWVDTACTRNLPECKGQ
jgi:hypothetical protein